jgi:hypothetical protein
MCSGPILLQVSRGRFVDALGAKRSDLNVTRGTCVDDVGLGDREVQLFQLGL